MNIIEAKSVLARANAEYNAYCDFGNSDEWYDVGRTVGAILELMNNPNAEGTKTFVLQYKANCYEATYLQIFDEKKVALIKARNIVVENVAQNYIVPVAKLVKIKSVLGEPEVKKEVLVSRRGMGGVG